MAQSQRRIDTWLKRDPDPETRAELQALVDAGNDQELERRFAARLEFGTAGLRGLLGAGPGRMNRLVVRETTAGLCEYLESRIADARGRGVVVGFDGRRGSRIFAEDAAGVLTARGFRVYLGEFELPTPVCAFATKALGAAAGIVVTASHNPPDYNGYKVYWENAAQIIAPHDEGIAAAIERAATRPIPFLEPGARPADLIVPIGEDLVARYLGEVEALSVHKERGGRADLGIAYTPLHGVGARVLEPALARAGFTKVRTVPSQREPDGRFPTVKFPNPEEPGAMDAVMALAREMDAALAIANDPDADRLAVAVRTKRGEYRMLSGNQIGALLGADLLEAAAAAGEHVAVATTIVSSRMLEVMARAAGALYFETLTGFKWIANGALQLGEIQTEVRFAFGYEEALGYTVGTLVRDKDGISAAVAFAEMTQALAARGLTVLDRLEALYRAHGLFAAEQRTLAVQPDAKGPSLGAKLRAAPPLRLAGREVVALTDLESGKRSMRGGKSEPVELPKSDVLLYELQDGARVIVRPSGTEPKIKCYYEVRETMGASETFAAAETRARGVVKELADAHQRELASLL